MAKVNEISNGMNCQIVIYKLVHALWENNDSAVPSTLILKLRKGRSGNIGRYPQRINDCFERS